MGLAGEPAQTGSRRAFLRVAGGAAATVAAVVGPAGRAGAQAAGVAHAGAPAGSTGTARVTSSVPFYGRHQAGIATPRQAQLRLAAFDLITTSRSQLAALLQAWTRAAARMAAGRPADRTDSGETVGLPPSSLTITFGFGPDLFNGRFGLAAARPANFAQLPPFPGDQLDPASSGGDLVVQACAEDQTVAFHAVRQLADLARGVATLRWSQAGFYPSAQLRPEATARNLFGFKDGTANPVPGTLSFSSAVWAAPPDRPSWVHGGSYLCVRRIRMDLSAWDRTIVPAQEEVIGRHKVSGAPLSGGSEHSPFNFAARTPTGSPAIPLDSHVRLADEVFNGGATMLRRGYSYDDGYEAQRGTEDAGLLFLAYVRDVQRQFIPIQQRLASSDQMNRFTTHVASAVFVIPPGTGPGGWIGQPLFG